MSAIKEWTICVCITLIIATIFSIIAPSGKLNSFYKIIIAIFIFLSFVVPFKDINFNDLNLDEINIKVIDDNTKICENMINSTVQNVLDNHQIVGSSVTTSITINDDEIYVDDVQVSIPDCYKIEDVKKTIFDELSINARVIYVGD